eukprot:scaffold15379_cov133-Isochrysis_galbana.AAC.7
MARAMAGLACSGRGGWGRGIGRGWRRQQHSDMGLAAAARRHAYSHLHQPSATSKTRPAQLFDVSSLHAGATGPEMASAEDHNGKTVRHSNLK